MSKREPRPPGSSRKPGRPKQTHVASSRERALEYLRTKCPTDAENLRGVAVWAQVESSLGLRRTKTGKSLQKRILGRIGSLRALVPPLLRLRIEKELQTVEEAFSGRIEADKRRSVALALLRDAARAGKVLPPMTLLAVAISVGCELPNPTESGQARLYDAWKKRHAVASRRVRKEMAVLRRAEQADQLARAMARHVPAPDPATNPQPAPDSKREVMLRAIDHLREQYSGKVRG